MRQAISVESQSESFPASLTLRLLDLFEGPVLVANLSGGLLLVNERARHVLGLPESGAWARLNLFGDILRMDPQVLLGQIESGESEVDLQLETASGRVRARLAQLPNSESLVLRLEPAGNTDSSSSVSQILRAHRAIVAAGAGNHLSQFAGRVFTASGGKPAKDGVSRVSGSRAENAACGDQRLLRPACFQALWANSTKNRPTFCRNQKIVASAWYAWFPCS